MFGAGTRTLEVAVKGYLVVELVLAFNRHWAAVCVRASHVPYLWRNLCCSACSHPSTDGDVLLQPTLTLFRTKANGFFYSAGNYGRATSIATIGHLSMTTEKFEESTPLLTQEPLQKTVQLTEHWSPVAQVAEACDLPRADIIAAAEKGAVWWQKANGAEKYRKPVRVRSLDSKVSAGDLILINYNKQVLEEASAVPVLVSDQGNYSVWNKPAGMLSQGTKWSDHCSITYAVEKIHLKKSFLVHRLDRAASGLIVIAHTKNALVALTDMFAKRRMEKTYQAIVQGVFSTVLPHVIESPIDGKEAHTEILSATVQEGKASDNPAGSKDTPESPESCLIVKIRTGRKHQIRSHLASLGYPVVGDRLFDKDRTHTVDLKLTSIGLSFACPFSGVEQNISLHSE